jgi:periplasmic divalent cation tolerance protein
MSYIFVYITCPNKANARKMAKLLISNKLIACANIFPINSIYPWEGKIREDMEFSLIVKTTDNRFEKIKKILKENHPYDVPCVTKIPVEPNDSYAQWLESVLR